MLSAPAESWHSAVVLRLEFTAEDVLGTRFAEGPAPLIELCATIALVQQQRPAAVFAPWVTRIRRTGLPTAVQPLTALIPPSGRGPLFLDPPAADLSVALDRVRSAPPELVAADLRRICPAERPVTAWTSALGRMEHEPWHSVERALEAGFDTLLAPHWPRVQAAFQADVAWRNETVARCGLGRMLADLLPGGHWEGSTLVLPARRDLRVPVGGNGLTLLPTTMWTGEALFGCYPDGTALLVYPALTPLPVVDTDPGGGPALTDLLGSTRAAVLRVLHTPHTTTGLARELGISPASASEHAKTLRAAGLVATCRQGKAVLHTRTLLGTRLGSAVNMTT